MCVIYQATRIVFILIGERVLCSVIHCKVHCIIGQLYQFYIVTIRIWTIDCAQSLMGANKIEIKQSKLIQWSWRCIYWRSMIAIIEIFLFVLSMSIFSLRASGSFSRFYVHLFIWWWLCYTFIPFHYGWVVVYNWLTIATMWSYPYVITFCCGPWSQHSFDAEYLPRMQLTWIKHSYA